MAEGTNFIAGWYSVDKQEVDHATRPGMVTGIDAVAGRLLAARWGGRDSETGCLVGLEGLGDSAHREVRMPSPSYLDVRVEKEGDARAIVDGQRQTIARIQERKGDYTVSLYGGFPFDSISLEYLKAHEGHLPRKCYDGFLSTPSE